VLSIRSPSVDTISKRVELILQSFKKIIESFFVVGTSPYIQGVEQPFEWSSVNLNWDRSDLFYSIPGAPNPI